VKVGIVIPALNEAATIGDVVASVSALGQVIVVDDGSGDGTHLVAGIAGAAVVRHESNHGYDAALASGYEKAIALKCDVVATIDADGQISAASLDAALALMQGGSVDIVIGVREHSARFAEALFSAYANWRFQVPDILCGLKVFTAGVYERHGGLTRTSSINTALALAALRDGVRHATVPVTVYPRDGESRFGSGLKVNWEILKVLLKAIFRDCRIG
jgi:glycosyltransferase involved in cell wall biosynthesis